MENPWNTQMRLEIDSDHKRRFYEFYDPVMAVRGKKRLDAIAKNPLSKETLEYIENLYFKEEYGLKVLARALGISYTDIRTIFKILNINFRSGHTVITNRVKQFRSERVQGDKNPFYDWTVNESLNKMHKNIEYFGLQGYYRKKDGSFVWLRSTWEYIYAKWLDNKHLDWGIENKQYKLNNGECYRPDFFIKTDQGELIVEIKGWKKNRVYKYDMLKQEHPELKLCIIDDIKLYTESYGKDLKEWKILRVQNQELKESMS